MRHFACYEKEKNAAISLNKNIVLFAHEQKTKLG